MKILVTYASCGGNTMMVAEKIFEVLQAEGQTEVTLKDMAELKPEELLEYPFIYFGSSTWGDGEFNDFSQIFFDQLANTDIDLSEVRFALYGLGETFYPIFCGVIDKMIEGLEAKKGKIVGEHLKIDGYPDETVMPSVEEWTRSILSEI
jgi:flavodoxin I